MIPEILAPAGSMEALRAAVSAGADAVYLGGSRFGARAYADNFGEAELLEAIAYCHRYGVKVYLTVNTLFRNGEMKELYDYLAPLYEAGLDAVIVQDLGVMSYLNQQFPGLPLPWDGRTRVSARFQHPSCPQSPPAREWPCRNGRRPCPTTALPPDRCREYSST